MIIPVSIETDGIKTEGEIDVNLEGLTDEQKEQVIDSTFNDWLVSIGRV